MVTRSQGLLGFFHDNLRAAVRSKYLPNLNRQNFYRFQLIQYFEVCFHFFFFFFFFFFGFFFFFLFFFFFFFFFFFHFLGYFFYLKFSLFSSIIRNYQKQNKIFLEYSSSYHTFMNKQNLLKN